jgi:hypothetical protein
MELTNEKEQTKERILEGKIKKGINARKKGRCHEKRRKLG